MANIKKFLEIVSKEDTKTVEKNKWRIENREALRESGRKAFAILEKIDELNWPIERLSLESGIGVSEVGKVVTGAYIDINDTTQTLLNFLNITVD